MELLLTEWRAKIPSDSLNAEHEAGRTPHTAQLVYLPTALDFNHPKVHQILGKADVLVFQRNALSPDVWAAMDYWRTLGKIVTLDADDHYYCLPPSNPAWAYWIANKGNMPMYPPDALMEGLRHVDAFTSPSKVMIKDVEHIAPGFWLPNWPRRMWYEKCVPKPLGSPDIAFSYSADPQNAQQMLFNGQFREGSEEWIVLGWGGSISHVDSWVYSGAIEALDVMFEKYPNLRLKFCGYEQRLDYLLNRWGDRVIRQIGVKPEHWPFVVSTFDIGLAPLDMRVVPSNTGKEGETMWEGGTYSYDERRSWLKGIEYMAAGVPWLATRSTTYEGIARHGTMVENAMDDPKVRTENWTKALDSAIQNLPARKILAMEKKKWALRKMCMEARVNEYVETYERIGNLKQTRRGTLPGVFWHKPVVATA